MLQKMHIAFCVDHVLEFMLLLERSQCSKSLFFFSPSKMLFLAAAKAAPRWLGPITSPQAGTVVVSCEGNVYRSVAPLV